jgi:hypothetical protein
MLEVNFREIRIEYLFDPESHCQGSGSFVLWGRGWSRKLAVALLGVHTPAKNLPAVSRIHAYIAYILDRNFSLAGVCLRANNFRKRTVGTMRPRYEGESRPPTVRKLAAALDVDPRELLAGYLWYIYVPKLQCVELESEAQWF